MSSPNQTPVGNLDFVSPLEAVNALQRNWQIARIQTTTLTTSFSASTIYGVIVDGTPGVVGANGMVQIFDNTTTPFLTVHGPQVAYFQMGVPTNYAPPGGACFAVTNSTGLNVTVLYK
jgi:hypothetical protein